MTNKVDWAAHLQAIETEGISIKDYAAREGLSVASLYYHRRRVSDEGRRTEGASPLVAVQLAERRPPVAVPIRKAGRARGLAQA